MVRPWPYRLRWPCDVLHVRAIPAYRVYHLCVTDSMIVLNLVNSVENSTKLYYTSVLQGVQLTFIL